MNGQVFLPKNPYSSAPLTNQTWINVSVIGVVLATFLSDFSHTMCPVVFRLYLSTLGLGPAALGLIEVVTDFSISKLAGDIVGHHVRHKRRQCLVYSL